jgi:hypothetical protein
MMSGATRAAKLTQLLKRFRGLHPCCGISTIATPSSASSLAAIARRQARAVNAVEGRGHHYRRVIRDLSARTIEATNCHCKLCRHPRAKCARQQCRDIRGSGVSTLDRFGASLPLKIVPCWHAEATRTARISGWGNVNLCKAARRVGGGFIVHDGAPCSSLRSLSCRD